MKYSKFCYLTRLKFILVESFSNRIMSHEGGMNPEFGLVDIVPDEDLNTRLKFYVSSSRWSKLSDFSLVESMESIIFLHIS